MPETQNITFFAGSYLNWPTDNSGGITVLQASKNGRVLAVRSRIVSPADAGYLAYSQKSKTLYAVNEVKTDGEGPVSAPAAIHALSFDEPELCLRPKNTLRVPGAFPTYLHLDSAEKTLALASHGSFDHVEKIVKTETGWSTEYVYDDSSATLIDLDEDGSLGSISDIAVFNERGINPNGSPQAGGHAQASGHAHCSVFDPSGEFLVVCDKATDKITVFRVLNQKLEPIFVFHCGSQTGPRHLVFSPDGKLAFATLEFSSELASFAFDSKSGELSLLDRVSTVGIDFVGLNEPADVRVHPNLQVVYVNNRGEDSVAWFAYRDNGSIERLGHISLSKSVHPGLAARSFAVHDSGFFMLVADRPANSVKSYEITSNGSLGFLTEIAVPNAAFIEFA